MSKPKLDKTLVRVMTSVDEELKSKLEEVAHSQQRSVSSLIYFILKDYFKNH